MGATALTGRHPCCPPSIAPPLLPSSVQQAVVDEATTNMQQPPVDLLQGTVPEFRRVAMQGVYDHSRAKFIGPRPLRWAPALLQAAATGACFGVCTSICTTQWRSQNSSGNTFIKLCSLLL